MSIQPVIAAMNAERSDLRMEAIEMQKSMHRVVFGFVSVAILLLGIYSEERIIPDEDARRTIVFALAQIECFLALFLVALNINLLVHSGYIAALENEINEALGRPVGIWESEVTVRFLFRPGSLFSFTLGYGFIFLLAFFVILIALSFPIVDNFFGSMVLLEVVAILLLLAFSHAQADRVRRYAMRRFQDLKRDPATGSGSVLRERGQEVAHDAQQMQSPRRSRP